METHHELAALVARLGPAVLEDPLDLRAAFDDRAPTGRTTDGQVNLLVDAIRLGVLARVLAQLGDGAQPGRALDAQARRLAELRGGTDVDAARWALAALLFALGRVNEAEVVVRAPAPPLTLVPIPPAATPTVVPDAGTALAAPLLPLQPPDVRDRSGPNWALAVLLALVLAFVAGLGLVAVLVSRGDGDRPAGSRGAAPPPVDDAQVVAAGTVVATSPSTATGTARAPVATIAGRTGGVRVSGLRLEDRVPGKDGPLVAAPRSRLRTFTLADGPCQEEPCRSWSALPLQVVVDGRSVALPAGGPSYAVAVPIGASAELRLDLDGYDQRVSLRDGAATGRNIAVLTRPDTRTTIGADLVLRPTADAPLGPDAVRAVHVGEARLFFFDGSRGLRDPARAYLAVDVTYTTPDDGRARRFELADLHLEAADGTAYPRRDLTPDTPSDDTVFIVPATFESGTLVIEGTRRVTTRTSRGGTGSVLLTLPRTTVRVRMD
ncbi:hypothetical protein [Nocardioides daeguensis]|uniref:PEGA domain-containing protein n=1 Tax=Nocardioides daeguensis TaxID=908359 RepID=A0ABP6W1J9_9ACTN|nr:hypothetical protein [Nocardioides daeguensis]MBV6726653.1 hypothetical protein [Nocardioides daeguensis]MCR1774595.1 hypothetical protein [Nocardioides daeguensis]